MKRKKTITYAFGGTISGAKIKITVEGNYNRGYGRDGSREHVEATASTIIRAISDKSCIPLTYFKST